MSDACTSTCPPTSAMSGHLSSGPPCPACGCGQTVDAGFGMNTGLNHCDTVCVECNVAFSSMPGLQRVS